MLGGYLADRYLGQRKAVLFGAVLLTFGHFLMAFEGDGGQNDATHQHLLAGLAFIIVGSGFLKANISVIVGQLYPRTDVRRDGAYTIFYMGINLGAALGTLLVRLSRPDLRLGATASALPASACCWASIVFVLGKPLLLGRGEPRDPARLSSMRRACKFEWLLYVVGFARRRRHLGADPVSGGGRMAAGRSRRPPRRLCRSTRGDEAASARTATASSRRCS